MRAQAILDKKTNSVNIYLRIAPGWHVNANKPLDEYFIPTKVSVKTKGLESKKIIYPATVKRKLRFNDGEMTLYEGSIEIIVLLDGDHSGRVKLKITLQACSEEICLEPVEGILLARE